MRCPKRLHALKGACLEMHRQLMLVDTLLADLKDQSPPALQDLGNHAYDLIREGFYSLIDVLPLSEQAQFCELLAGVEQMHHSAIMPNWKR
jgi:hypothetical protein